MTVPLWWLVHDGVQILICQHCPQAIFVHCYTHQLNLVLLHSTKNIEEFKPFTCNLTVFYCFFSNLVRFDFLWKQGCKLLHPTYTRCNYHLWAVSNIIERDDWDSDFVGAAICLLNILKSTYFMFYLCVYNRSFVFTQHLFNIL